MNDHVMGYAMGEVCEEVLKLFDAREISLSAAQSLIEKQHQITLAYDGNTGEFMEHFIYRCALCFKKVNKDCVKSDLLYGSVGFCVPQSVSRGDVQVCQGVSQLFYDGKIIAPVLCHSCWDKMKGELLTK